MFSFQWHGSCIGQPAHADLASSTDRRTLPRLDNPLEERFATLIAAGVHPKLAYSEVKPDTAKPAESGSRWKRIPSIRARINEIYGARDLEPDDAESIRVAIAAIHRVAMEGVPVVNAQGVGIGIKRDLPTALRCAQLLAPRTGALDKIDPRNIDVSDMPRDEMRKFVQELAPKIGLRLVPEPDPEPESEEQPTGT